MTKVSMDILTEALFQAVLSEEDKPLLVRHRQVKDRILDAEDTVRKWTKPKVSDPGNERVLLELWSAEPHKQPATPRANPACAANAPGSSLGFWRRSGDRAKGGVS